MAAVDFAGARATNRQMNYMLLVYSPEEMPDHVGEVPEGCAGLAEKLHEQGKLLDGAILHGSKCSTTVQVRHSQRFVTDGPFAETREQLAGYMIINVANLDEAIAVAAQHPTAKYGSVEIRPFWLPPMAHSGAFEKRAKEVTP